MVMEPLKVSRIKLLSHYVNSWLSKRLDKFTVNLVVTLCSGEFSKTVHAKTLHATSLRGAPRKIMSFNSEWMTRRVETLHATSSESGLSNYVMV